MFKVSIGAYGAAYVRIDIEHFKNAGAPLIARAAAADAAHRLANAVMGLQADFTQAWLAMEAGLVNLSVLFAGFA